MKTHLQHRDAEFIPLHDRVASPLCRSTPYASALISVQLNNNGCIVVREKRRASLKKVPSNGNPCTVAGIWGANNSKTNARKDVRPSGLRYYASSCPWDRRINCDVGHEPTDAASENSG